MISRLFARLRAFLCRISGLTQEEYDRELSRCAAFMPTPLGVACPYSVSEFYRLEEERAKPKHSVRKLFLSFGAVIHGLKTARVTEEDLKYSLFCCTARELSEANHLDDEAHSTALRALALARTEQRLVWQAGDEYANETTFRQVNELLAQHGVAPLLGSHDEDRILAEIPMRCAVPTVSDKSVEVLWAAVPLHKDWKKSWGVK